MRIRLYIPLALVMILSIFMSACQPIRDTRISDDNQANSTAESADMITPNAKMEIWGKVIDTEGSPVNGIGIAVFQAREELRVDLPLTGEDGTFRVELPFSDSPNWYVTVVSFSCRSRVRTDFNPICNKEGVPSLTVIDTVTVTVPLSEPVTLMYEKATTTITGKVVPAGGMDIMALRTDGVHSYGRSSNNGEFTLLASDGTWKLYAYYFKDGKRHYGEGVIVEVIDGKSEFVIVTAP